MPPGFRPADFLEDPLSFGRTEKPRWRKVAEGDRPKLAASYLQHRVALSIRGDFGERSAEMLAERLGNPDQLDYLRRKLNGQVPVHLVELFEWSFVVGPQIWPGELMNSSELLP